MLQIAVISLVSFVVNLPLGVWRERTRKFSWQWFLAIHASIPLIIVLRVVLELPLVAIPLNIAAAVLGQYLGGRPAKRRRKAAVPSAT